MGWVLERVVLKATDKAGVLQFADASAYTTTYAVLVTGVSLTKLG